MIPAVPTPIVVTAPVEEFTVATLVFDEFHVNVLPGMAFEFESLAVAVNGVLVTCKDVNEAEDTLSVTAAVTS